MKKIIAVVCVFVFSAVVFFNTASASHPCFKILGAFFLCDHFWGGGLQGYLTTNPNPVKPQYAQNGKAGPVQWEEVWDWNDGGFNAANSNNYVSIDHLRAIITSIPSNRYIEPQLRFTQILPPGLEELVDATKKTVPAKKGTIDLTGYVSKNGGPITFKVELTARVLEGRGFVRKPVAEGVVSNKRIDTGIPHSEIANVIPSNSNEVRPLSPITGQRGICAVNTQYYDYDYAGRALRRWRNDVEPVPVKVFLNHEDDNTPNNSGVVAVKFGGDIYQYSNKTWMPFTAGKWIEVLLTPGPGFKIIQATAADNSLNYTSGSTLPGHVSSEDGGFFVAEVLNCLPGQFPLPRPLLPPSKPINQDAVNSDASFLPTSMYPGAMNGDASAGEE